MRRRSRLTLDNAVRYLSFLSVGTWACVCVCQACRPSVLRFTTHKTLFDTIEPRVVWKIFFFSTASHCVLREHTIESYVDGKSRASEIWQSESTEWRCCVLALQKFAAAWPVDRVPVLLVVLTDRYMTTMRAITWSSSHGKIHVAHQTIERWKKNTLSPRELSSVATLCVCVFSLHDIYIIDDLRAGETTRWI